MKINYINLCISTNKKEFNNMTTECSLAEFGPTIAAFVAVFVAWWQAEIARQNNKISLYNIIYKKLYLNFLNTVEKLHNVLTINKDKSVKDICDELDNIMKNFCSDLDYIRFLIKEKDFEKIKNIYTKISSEIIKYHTTNNENTKNRVEDWKNLDKKIQEEKDKFIDIVKSYLCIEKESLFKRLFKKILDFKNGNK